jgi:hypothetical protein
LLDRPVPQIDKHRILYPSMFSGGVARMVVPNRVASARGFATTVEPHAEAC